jgi:2Fe-2S ferredoxin
MPDVTFITTDGSEHVVSGRDGESLMQLGVQAGVPGIDGECGGEMSCATCHVWIENEWAGKLRAASQDELDLLELDDNFSDCSRLGCQIKLNEKTDGIVAKIPGRV